MQRERLTPDRIRRFNCAVGMKQAFLWDTEAPRLAVRVTAAGAKSFIFEAKLHRQTIRQTIGDVRAWNIDDARAEARRLQTLVDQDIDPREVRAAKLAAIEARRERARRTEAPALDAWAGYIDARRAKWGARTLADHEAVVGEGGKPKTRGRKKGEGDTTQPGILRPLLSRPLERIDAEAVRDWLKQEAANRPTHAALAFRLLRAFLNWCASTKEFAGLVHVDACKTRAARDELPKKAAKDDCLQREQLALWFEKVRALSNPVHSAYLQALLLTGVELYRAESKVAETITKYGKGTPDDWIERNLYTRFSWQGVGLMMIIDLALFGAGGLAVWALQMAWTPIMAAGMSPSTATTGRHHAPDLPQASPPVRRRDRRAIPA